MNPRLSTSEIMENVRNSDSYKKTREANKALNELCDLIGIDLLGVTIEGGGNALRVPVDLVNEINARIAALKGSSPLADGTL